MLPEFDQFGPQIETVMGYKGPGESDDQARVSFALYDTGASVVTYSAGEQLLYDLLGSPIPIKVPGGATADAIGGALVGDVSQPGEIIADGLHAVTISSDILDIGIDLSEATRTEGVQAFVGTTEGSPILPTITGTVVHNPSPTHPNGVAALIDMTAYQLDFGELFPEIPEFAGIVIDLPDLRFVEPGMQLTAPDETITPPVRIPLELWGENNHGNPGDSITTSPNPVQTGVTLRHGAAESTGRTLLFDTGAQLSVISTEIATELGLDLDNPSTSITVQGAAGQVTVPGFTIDALELPRDDDANGSVDGVLRFSSAPIYVLDVVPGLDGLIGMNLFNLAKGMLYDPHDAAGPSLQLTFFTDLVRELPDEEELSAIDMLTQAFPAFNGAFGGQVVPGFGLDVPELVNRKPIAWNDEASSDEGAPQIIDVLNNDLDPDGDTLTIISVSDPGHGAVVINGDNTITYTPDSGFSGTDTFTYTVSDGQGGEANATVEITVTLPPENADPQATDDEAPTDEDTPVTIQVLANDQDDDGDTLSIVAVTAPSHGAIAVNDDNTIRYTPDDNFHGTDAFTYTIGDSRGGEATATVTVTVNSVNDAPTAIELTGDAVDENAAGATIGTLTVTDPDDGDTHELSVSDDRFEVVQGVLKLKDGVALDYETAATVVLQVTAIDSGVPAASLTQEFVLRVNDVTEAEHSWQNPDPENREDVNDDGAVDIKDLLAIVRVLRDYGNPFDFNEPLEQDSDLPPYPDVDGDGKVSVLDLVAVVKKLRDSRGGGPAGEEGELDQAGPLRDAVFSIPWGPRDPFSDEEDDIA